MTFANLNAEEVKQLGASAEMVLGLRAINEFKRPDLLRILGRDPCKTNTEKLRSRVRILWIRGKIPARHIWLGGRSL